MRREELSALQGSFSCNRAFFSLVAEYLNHFPRLVTAEMIASLTEDCGVSEDEAFCAVLCAALDVDEERSEEERRLAREYFAASVKKRDVALYQNDPYYRHIRVPSKTVGEWRLCQETYAPYEGFVCGDLSAGKAPFSAIPPIGYFGEEFSFPAVMQNGVEWMAIKPNEIETMRKPLARARGRVLCMGLGLGYYAYMASEKPSVSSVTVIERDPAVIRLFKEELLPQFANGKKITVVCEDAFTYAERTLGKGGFDTVFADLWHDASDGLPLYARLRQLERRVAAVPFDYWIEDMLLCHLRDMLFDGISRAAEGSGAPLRAERILSVLTDDHLRTLIGETDIAKIHEKIAYCIK